MLRMPQICGHSRTLAFTQVAHAFGAHSQSHGTLLPRRSVPPTVEELGHRLGHDAASSTCLAKLRNSLMHAEARCAEWTQKDRDLSGQPSLPPTPKKNCRKHVQSHASVIMFLRWHIM